MGNASREGRKVRVVPRFRGGVPRGPPRLSLFDVIASALAGRGNPANEFNRSSSLIGGKLNAVSGRQVSGFEASALRADLSASERTEFNR